MKVLACVVNYRTDEALARCLASMHGAARAAPVALDVLVIDNSGRTPAEQASLRARVQAACPQADVAFPERNLGYFGALDLPQERSRRTAPDAVLYCNADLTLDAGFFAALSVHAGSDAAVLAPAILTDAGSGFDQNPKQLRRTSGRHLRRLQRLYSSDAAFRAYAWLGRVKERLRTRRPAAVAPGQPIYAPHGAIFVFAQRAFFESLPRYPPFLFGEELFVAEQARRAGQLVRYRPELRVFDTRHASTGTLPLATRRRYMKESVDFILREYY